MRVVQIASFVVILGIGSVNLAKAQEAGQVGLTFGFPPSVGLVWQVSDHISLRPTAQVAGVNENGQKSTTIGAGISALVFLHTWDNLRAYVGPNFSYSRAKDDVNPPNGFTSTTSGYTGAGFFGTQYALNRRFSIFGEVGFSYTHFGFSSTLAGASQSTRSTWGTTTGIGAILYF
jgi:hypothetical protein